MALTRFALIAFFAVLSLLSVTVADPIDDEFFKVLQIYETATKDAVNRGTDELEGAFQRVVIAILSAQKRGILEISAIETNSVKEIEKMQAEAGQDVKECVGDKILKISDLVSSAKIRVNDCIYKKVASVEDILEKGLSDLTRLRRLVSHSIVDYGLCESTDCQVKVIEIMMDAIFKVGNSANGIVDASERNLGEILQSYEGECILEPRQDVRADVKKIVDDIRTCIDNKVGN